MRGNFWILLLGGALLATPAAAIDYSGTCSGTVPAAGSPHRLVGACTVSAGTTFTLEPGATLDGQGFSLNIFGDTVADEATLEDTFLWVFSGGSFNADLATLSGNSASLAFYHGSSGSLTNSSITGGSSCRVTADNSAPAIEGNTFDAVSSAICVVGGTLAGPAGPSIRNNMITASSRGVDYNSGTIGGTVEGNTIGFSGTSFGRIAIELTGSVSPVVDDNTILDDPGQGDMAIHLGVTGLSSARITNNDLCTTGDDVPLRIDPRALADSATVDISGNVFSCGTGAGIQLTNNTLTADTTLGPINGETSLTLISGLTVDAAATLTVASGMNLTGGSMSVFGDLDADGVTFDDLVVYYYDGSGGTFQNSSVDASSAFFLSGSSVVDPPAPVLRNNVLDVTNTAIDVTGTSQPTVEGNQITTNWRGIRYSGSSAGTAVGNQIDFVPEGSSFRVGIEIEGASSPVVDGNTVLDDVTRQDIGIEADVNESSATQVINNSLCATGNDEPLRIDPGFFADGSTATIAGNLFDCGLGAGLALLGDTLAANTTVTGVNGQTSYTLTGVVTVNAGQTLTLASGLTLVGSGGFGIYGDLDADGVVFDQVYFSYYDGSGGTLENSQLTQGSPIYLSGSSVIDPPAPLLRNNTINASSTAINVSGTSQPTIEGNSIVTNWIGIGYSGTAAGTASGNQIGFLPEGSWGRRGIDLQTSASPVVDGNTILDDPTRDDFGISLQITQASTAEVTNNSICATGGDSPLQVSVNAFADSSPVVLTGNTFDCGLARGFALYGTLTSDATVGSLGGQSRFRLNSTLFVPAGLRLELLPGFELDGALHQFLVDGTLEADQISLLDTFLRFDAGSDGSLTNSTVEGRGYMLGVYVLDGSPVFTGNHFEGFSVAVELDGATTAELTSNTFEGNSSAVAIRGGEALATVGGNQFVGNIDSLRFHDANSLFSSYPADFATNTFSGPVGSNLVWLPSPWNVSGVLGPSPVPYKNTHGLTLTNGAQVTLQAGVVIASSNFRSITAEPGTRLLALGTPELPVVFTDFDHTDSARWSGLVLRDDASLLQGCVIELSAGDGVRLQNASVTISDCVITDHGGDGLDLTGNSAPTIQDSAIVRNLGSGVRVDLVSAPAGGSEVLVDHSSLFSNGGLGIDNRTPTVFDVVAISNYWGDDSGPFDNSDDSATGGLFNPTGQGQSVSDGVAYDPWIHLGPSQAGVLLAMSGSGQVGTVGTVLPDPLVIEVQSTLGTPLEGIEVIFSIVEGDAQIVEPQPLLSDALGQASATVQLGMEPGEVLIAVTARDVDSPLATFMAETDDACVMSLTAVPLEPTPGLGDVNSDGRVDNRDAALVAAVLDGVLPEESPLLASFAVADVNADGRVDRGDLRAIQSYVVGMVFWTPQN